MLMRETVHTRHPVTHSCDVSSQGLTVVSLLHALDELSTSTYGNPSLHPGVGCVSHMQARPQWPPIAERGTTTVTTRAPLAMECSRIMWVPSIANALCPHLPPPIPLPTQDTTHVPRHVAAPVVAVGVCLHVAIRPNGTRRTRHHGRCGSSRFEACVPVHVHRLLKAASGLAHSGPSLPMIWS